MKNKTKSWIAFIVSLFTILTCCSAAPLLKENRYIKSIKLGGEWFLNNQDESFLYYQYDAKEKQHPKKHHSLRETGALWSVAKLSNFLNDPRYDSLALKGFRYFEEHFEYDKEKDFYFVNITPNKIKLGYSAFMILTLLEIDHPRKEYYLDKFANGIMLMQKKNGSLRTFFYSNRSTGTDYYPGEALLY